VNRGIAAIDLAIALALALLVLIVSPGVAVTGMIAALVLVICGVTFAVGGRRRQRRR
jgi:hypothetical protein